MFETHTPLAFLSSQCRAGKKSSLGVVTWSTSRRVFTVGDIVSAAFVRVLPLRRNAVAVSGPGSFITVVLSTFVYSTDHT